MKGSKKSIGFIAIIVSLGGFLFGFDTAVISGAEQAIQKKWELGELMHGLAIAIALIGTVIGALFAGFPSDRLGRKRTLIWIAILYLISAIGSALAPEIYSFMFFRFIGGLGVGASSVTAPMYISEISPAASRGKLVATFQFNIVFGIMIAYLSNYLLQDLGPQAWRWMLGVEAVPAIFFLLLLPSVPYSPRWLIVQRNDPERAASVLRQLYPLNISVESAVNQIQASHQTQQKASDVPFFTSRFSFSLILAVLIALFNQFTGINAIIYFAPRIFEMTGLEKSASLLSTAGVGLVNFIFTLIGMQLIDRMGRRTLILSGSLGMLIALVSTSIAFYSENFSAVPIYIFAFIGFFAVSQGVVIWVYISEVFPNEVRGRGQALGSFTHWILAAAITFTFPYFASRFGGAPIFTFFAVMTALQLLFAWRIMPETKGRTLEEIEQAIKKKI